MAKLDSKNSLGGEVGDTYGNSVIAAVHSPGVYSWVEFEPDNARSDFFDLGGQFLLDPNEINTWGVIGPFDDVNNQDIGNADTDAFAWTAGGMTRPFDYEIVRIYLKIRESNSSAHPWGLILGHAETFHNSTQGLSPTHILNESVDNAGVGPRDHGNTNPHIIDIDVSNDPNKIVPALHQLTFGISSPTSPTTNYYIQISTGFIEYKRIV